MKKTYSLRSQNGSARSYYEIWPMVVFIRHDSAEIWGFRYGLALGIGTLKVLASTGVFVLVVCSLKHSTSGHGRQPSNYFDLNKT